MMEKGPFNFKTIFIGTVLSVLLVYMVMYSVNITHTDYLAEDHMPAGGIFIFFLLCVFINPIIKFFTKNRYFLSEQELLIIYSMLLVTSSVAEVGLGCQLFPILAGGRYYATPENRWDEIILPHIKNWLIPKDLAVVKGFFEGSKVVPWGYWIKIFSPWFVFLITFYFTSICIVSILRKQWVERERLLFALNNLPLAMASIEEKGGYFNSFFKNRLMWYGFIISFLFSSTIGLNRFFPSFPKVKIYQSFPIFRRTSSIEIVIAYPIIGFIYFVRTDISLSLWFFALFFKLLSGWFSMSGIGSSEVLGFGSFGAVGGPVFSHIGTGALLGYVLYSIWVSKGHLKEVYQNAIGKNRNIDDGGEIIPYTMSFWGMISGFIFMIIWLTLAGMNPLISFFFLLLVFFFLIGLTKAVVQGGIVSLKGPSIASDQVVSILGSENLGANDITNLGLSYIYHSDIRTYPFSSVFHTVKLGEKMGRNIRPLFWVIMWALIVGVVSSNFLLLKLAYKYGGLNLNNWYFQYIPKFPYQFISYHLSNPKGMVVSGIVYKIIGLIFMFLLVFLHTKFLWWPLHPIGFAVASTFRITIPWFSIFLGWLFKKMILTFGGGKLYQKGAFFFLGLIIGTYTAAGIWFIISIITGVGDFNVFYM